MLKSLIVQLYLIRHGKAANSPQDQDPVLTQQGKKECQEIASRLEIADFEIWHSTKKRAKETASIIAPNHKLIEKDGLKPNDLIDPIATELSYCTHNLVIVSHLPFLEKLIEHLDPKRLIPISFENSQVVALEKISENWSFLWTITPSKIKTI